MRTLALILLFLALGPYQADAPNVLVRANPNQAGLADALAQQAEELLARLHHEFGLQPGPRITVILAASKEEFREAQPRTVKAPDWAVGLAYPDLDLIVVKTGDLSPGNEPTRILAHEVLHIALGRLFGRIDPPTWLDEGLTMHLSGDWGVDRRVAMARAVTSQRVIPLEELVEGFPVERLAAETAYAQSYYFIAFLKDEYGPDATGRLVRSLALGAKPKYAFLQVTGKSLHRLEFEFDEWLRERFSIYWVLTSPEVLWPLAALIMLIAYWLKRRWAKKRLQEWEEEENEGKPQGPRGYFE
jgi:hypothetical protein